MSKEDEERFQLSKHWICDKLFIVRDDRVRYHCHITGKYRGYAHRVIILILNWLKKFL